MEFLNPPIVVVAYNRPNSLNRLLKSLAGAYYPNDEITLIISIDKGEKNQDVLRVAHEFSWVFGEKKIRYQESNLGLRKHIIKCASLSDEYGAVIILEDDLFVSPQFYHYTNQALLFCIDKDYIGGISLYNHQFNVNARENFSALDDGFDNWYFQFASSWGQAWTKKQWNGFYDWYLKNQTLEANLRIPTNVMSWSDKSWLKYYIYYLVVSDLYFLYPKNSLTTNFGDSGTHMERSTKYQVPLELGKNIAYKFSELCDSDSIYDVFFENKNLFKKLGFKEDELCIDLYGTKLQESINQRYLLSSKIYNYLIISTFARELKPADANIRFGIQGNDFFLYDTNVSQKNTYRYNFEKHIIYQFKYIARETARKIFILLYFKRFKRLFKGLFR